MATPKKETTPVTLWLRENNAEQFIKAFYNQGYYEMDSVDEAAIKELVTQKGLVPSLIRALPKAAESQPQGDPLAAPSLPFLPPGTTLDLSALELSAPGNITFQLPAEVSMQEREKAAIISANSLKMEDWMVIARNSQMLYGFQMDGATPKKAKTPILYWMIPKTTDFVRAEHDKAYVITDLTYTEQSASYTESGFNSQSASLGFPFCSASFERSQRVKLAKASYHKRLYMTGIWRYPRATLFLEKCAKVSPHFVRSIRQALKSDKPSPALDKIFEEYGHAYSPQVLLGGQLYFQRDEEADGSVQENTVESTIAAAVDIKLDQVGIPPTEGGAKARFEEGSAKKDAAHKLADSVSFRAFGGDTTLANSPNEWRDTIKDPKLWAVIENNELHSTIELLDDSLRKQVLDVWESGISSQPELDGRVVAISTPQRNQLFLGREVNAPEQTTPHPMRLPGEWRLKDPATQALAWRLKFSGYYGDNDDPLFWIELVGQNALLALTRTIHLNYAAADPQTEILFYSMLRELRERAWSGAFAALAPLALEQLPDPRSDADARLALWYVKPVDAAKFYGNHFKDAYYIDLYEFPWVLSSQTTAGAVLPPTFPSHEIGVILRNNNAEFSVLTPYHPATASKEEMEPYCWVLKELGALTPPTSQIQEIPGRLVQVSVSQEGAVWGVNGAGVVFKYVGGEQGWQFIPGTMSQIAVGKTSDIWGVNGDGNVLKYIGEGWLQFPGTLDSINITRDGTAWALSTQRDGFKYVGGEQGWQQIVSPGLQQFFKGIPISGSGGVDVNETKVTYKYVGAGWLQIPGTLSGISVASDGAVWGVNAQGEIYRFVGGENTWLRIPGSLRHIAVGSASTIWGVNAQGAIYKYVGGNQVWQQVPGTLTSISAANDGTVWGVNAQGEIYKYVGGNQVWRQVPGNLSSVSVRSTSEAWGVDAPGTIYKYASS